jgi:hypothetical protein
MPSRAIVTVACSKHNNNNNGPPRRLDPKERLLERNILTTRPKAEDPFFWDGLLDRGPVDVSGTMAQLYKG